MVGAVKEDGGDAGGAGTEHVEDIVVADVQRLVGGDSGAAQSFL